MPCCWKSHVAAHLHMFLICKVKAVVHLRILKYTIAIKFSIFHLITPLRF